MHFLHRRNADEARTESRVWLKNTATRKFEHVTNKTRTFHKHATCDGDGDGDNNDDNDNNV